jgi:hypothetical protein
MKSLIRTWKIMGKAGGYFAAIGAGAYTRPLLYLSPLNYDKVRQTT